MPGLNLLTGETGSGKSIVVDALGLLLGGRASAEMVRTGEAARARGRHLRRQGPAGVRRLLEPAGLEVEDGELLIEREILASGKSRAFVGSRPVAVSLLKELAPHLADIHGQHDQQLLFSAEAQRDMLDAFAGNRELLDRVGRRLRAVARRRGRAGGAGALANRRNCACWICGRFQRKEIESAGSSRTRRPRWRTSGASCKTCSGCRTAAAAAYEAVYESPESALSLARTAAKRVDELCRIDSSLEGLREHLKAADLSLQEVSYSLRDYLSGLEANPGRLEEMETRLAAIDKLKRKYGQSIAEVLAFLEEVRQQIAAVEHAGERMEQLRAAQKKLAAGVRDARGRADASAARRPRASWRSASKRNWRNWPWSGRCSGSASRAAEWSAQRRGSRWSSSSRRTSGEEPRPLEKVASGGEISRIALALKTCLAAPKSRIMRTLVFDEVDAGVGGSAAEGVGRRLKKLAAANQVLCVTHLPQIASFADHHYRVEKQESNGRTVAVDRRAGRRGAHPRSRPHAVRPEAHARSAEERGAADQDERRLTALLCRTSLRKQNSAPSTFFLKPAPERRPTRPSKRAS